MPLDVSIIIIINTLFIGLNKVFQYRMYDKDETSQVNLQAKSMVRNYGSENHALNYAKRQNVERS